MENDRFNNLPRPEVAATVRAAKSYTNCPRARSPASQSILSRARRILKARPLEMKTKIRLWLVFLWLMDLAIAFAGQRA
jgi:hypothetical protein